MKAYQLVRPRTFTRVDVPDPTPADVPAQHVLLRVLAGGICGSDLPMFLGRTTTMSADTGELAPEIPGYPLHEVVGVVEHSNHPDHAIGDRVVGWASGFNAIAEWCISSGDELYPCPTDLDPEVAVMLQPLACVIPVIDDLDVRGRKVAVIGLGPIGLLFTHVAKNRGAARVIGVDPVDRSEIAGSYGIDETVVAHSDRWAARLADDGRPDVVIEAVGHNVGTARDALNAAAFGAQVYAFGVPDEDVYPISLKTLLRKNLTLRSGVTLNRREALANAVKYLREHPQLAHGYVSHTFSIDDVQEAFDLMAAPQPGRLKVTLRMEQR